MSHLRRVISSVGLALFLCLAGTGTMVAGTAVSASASVVPAATSCAPGVDICNHGHHPKRHTKGCATTASTTTSSKCKTPPTSTHGNLPFTGSEMLIPGTIGGVILLSLGTMLVVASRRRKRVVLIA